jgi:AhpD family alkylhydroperoxidase
MSASNQLQPNPFHVAASHIEQMRQATLYTDGALSARTKTLAALLWSVSARCEPCVTHYARKAVELGASREELAEMLAIASTMGGCVGETWALKAFAAARETAGESGSDEACCTHA